MKKTIFTIALITVAVFATNIARAQYMPHVYINPGHGGHDSDDRNVVIYPYVQGDTAGYWESNSNLKETSQGVLAVDNFNLEIDEMNLSFW